MLHKGDRSLPSLCAGLLSNPVVQVTGSSLGSLWTLRDLGSRHLQMWMGEGDPWESYEGSRGLEDLRAAGPLWVACDEGAFG